MEEDTGRRLEIVQRWADSTSLVLEFGGHLDRTTIARVALCANDVCSTVAQSVRVDLSDVVSVDDAGLLILAAFCRILQRNGCGLDLLGPRPLVGDLLRQLLLAAEQEGQRVGVEFSEETIDGTVPLSPGQRRDLKLMERELARQEPGLAAEFARFRPQGR